MTDVMKTQYGSRITLLMEVLVEAVHKLVNYNIVSVHFPHQGDTSVDPVVYYQ